MATRKAETDHRLVIALRLLMILPSVFFSGYAQALDDVTGCVRLLALFPTMLRNETSMQLLFFSVGHFVLSLQIGEIIDGVTECLAGALRF